MSLNYNKSYNEEIRKWIEKNIQYTEFLSKQQLSARNCPLCSSANYSHFANNGFLDYSKCYECGLIFMNPVFDLSAINQGFRGGDDIIMSYFQIMKKYKNHNNISDSKPNPEYDNKLKDIYMYKKRGKLLDVGCSVGDFLHKAKHFYRVEGIEVNPETSLYAAKYFKVYTDYLDKLMLSQDYDIVTLNQIIYGVADPVLLLKDIYKVLKNDGILYINTPNSDSYAFQLFRGKVNHLYGYTTQNVFNMQSLNRLAEISGFKCDFFRTEWLDIYSMDIIEFYSNPNTFIHKRNTHLENYEENIKLEDETHQKMNIDLKNGGNYLIAILKKNEKNTLFYM